MVKRSPHRIWAWIAASGVAGCTAIVGVDQDYELDPRFGHGGSALTGGAGAGTGGAAVAGSGGTGGGGAGGTGGTAGNDAGKDAGGSGGGTGGSDASAGAGGSGGTGGTGGTGGVGGVGGASGTGGAGGVSGTGGAGGVSGTGGAGGVSGTGGASGTGGGGTGGGTTGGASGAGTGGSGGAAGTGGAAGSSGNDGGGAAGTGGSAGSGGTGGATTDGGDASTGGSAGATSDASSDAPDTPADLGSPCGPGTKFCGVCVATSDPTYGCAGPTCTPCEPNGTATCTAGNCVVTGCNSGYHQVGNACVPNGPEVCDNNIDDDADTRTDCFDTDCLAHASCVNKCTDATTIACDTVVTGQSSSGSGSTSRISSYSCAPGTYPGSEYAYRFTGGSGQHVFAEIYGLSGNLGLFQVGAASGQQCASSSCGAYGDAVVTAGAEALGFDTVPGQDYYLIVDGPQARNYAMSVQCTLIDGCRPVKPIEPGQSFGATNDPASGASNVTASMVPSYLCGGFNIVETGPEVAWIFTPTVTANYRVFVSGLSAAEDCDLFVLPATDCGGSCLGPLTFSVGTTSTETVDFSGGANTTYYIVVDGYMGDICNFNISLTQL